MDFLSSVLTQIVTYTTVYTLASLGVVIAGRTGVFNVAGEGIMLAGASAGFLAAFLSTFPLEQRQQEPSGDIRANPWSKSWALIFTSSNAMFSSSATI